MVNSGGDFQKDHFLLHNPGSARSFQHHRQTDRLSGVPLYVVSHFILEILPRHLKLLCSVTIQGILYIHQIRE